LNRKEYIAGLDIGTTKTCCVLADVDFETGGVDIVGVGLVPSDGLRKGVVVDLDSTIEAIRTVVDKAQKQAGNVQIRNVVVGVTGEHISSLNSRGVIAITSPDKEISHSDVDRVVEASKVIVLPPEREIIHSIPRGFTVDGQDGIRDPLGMSGGRLEVETHIVTGSSTFIDNVVKCVQRANLVVESTILEPIATSASAVIDAEKDLGVCLIDIGGGTTDVAMFTNGEIYYTSVLPIGGMHVTKDIAVGLRTSQDEAERAKIEFGCSMASMVGAGDAFHITSLGAAEARELPRQILASIIEPRMEEVLEKVRTELVKAGLLGMLPGGGVITGGGALLPGTVDLAEKILGMPVRLGLPREIGGLCDTVQSPIYTTAIGLVIYAAKQHAALHGNVKTAKLRGGLKGLLRMFGR
jgi:cell division protein FtsA